MILVIKFSTLNNEKKTALNFNRYILSYKRTSGENLNTRPGQTRKIVSLSKIDKAPGHIPV